MQRFTTQAIILTRTDFGEADRIITFLTPDHGKITAIAKGVRKSRSKLAGALEPFSVSQIMFLPGKNDVSTVMSAKLDKHYGDIVKDLSKTQMAYDFMKILDKTTPDKPEDAYFNLLNKALMALNSALNETVAKAWFDAQLLKITGHSPNLKQTVDGTSLEVSQKYNFDFDKMKFAADSRGKYRSNDIKLIRLCFSVTDPQSLLNVTDAVAVVKNVCSLLESSRSLQLGV